MARTVFCVNLFGSPAMYYLVTARLTPDRATRFHHQLTDGTIAAQQPDGEEIVASMNRARLSDDGRVKWSEVCYCTKPLAHQRQTVYDRFFTELHATEAKGYVEFAGQPRMEYLASLTD
jgi:hypothetical protein